jgi:hypothetical protein
VCLHVFSMVVHPAIAYVFWGTPGSVVVRMLLKGPCRLLSADAPCSLVTRLLEKITDSFICCAISIGQVKLCWCPANPSCWCGPRGVVVLEGSAHLCLLMRILWRRRGQAHWVCSDNFLCLVYEEDRPSYEAEFGFHGMEGWRQHRNFGRSGHS